MPLSSCRAQLWAEKTIPQIGTKSSRRRSSEGNKGHGKRREGQDCPMAGLLTGSVWGEDESIRPCWPAYSVPSSLRADSLPRGFCQLSCRASELSNHFKHGASPRWLCRGGQPANELRRKFLSSFSTGVVRHKTSPWLKGAGEKPTSGLGGHEESLWQAQELTEI